MIKIGDHLIDWSEIKSIKKTQKTAKEEDCGIFEVIFRSGEEFEVEECLNKMDDLQQKIVDYFEYWLLEQSESFE